MLYSWASEKFTILNAFTKEERVNAYETAIIHVVRVRFKRPDTDEMIEEIFQQEGPFTEESLSRAIEMFFEAEQRRDELKKEVAKRDRLLAIFNTHPNRLLKVELIMLVKLLLRHGK